MHKNPSFECFVSIEKLFLMVDFKKTKIGEETTRLEIFEEELRSRRSRASRVRGDIFIKVQNPSLCLAYILLLLEVNL